MWSVFSYQSPEVECAFSRFRVLLDSTIVSTGVVFLSV